MFNVLSPKRGSRALGASAWWLPNYYLGYRNVYGSEDIQKLLGGGGEKLRAA